MQILIFGIQIFRPVWLCAQCSVYYENSDIELQLIELLQRKLMSYTLQDLQCTRCKQIKRENILEKCPCAGDFTTLIPEKEIKRLLRLFSKVAELHKMEMLKESVDWILKMS